MKTGQLKSHTAKTVRKLKQRNNRPKIKRTEKRKGKNKDANP